MATTEEVRVRYSIEDQLSAGLKDISEETKEANKDLAEMAETTGKVAVAFGAVATAGAAAIGATIALSEKQELAERRVEQTIRSTGDAAGFTADQIKDMASEMQAATIYGDEDVLGAQNLLLTFTNIKDDVFPATLKSVADIASVMGTDLNQAAIQIGKAINDPKTGLAGLSRIGITFSEDQKDIIKNLVDMGQTAEAQAMILNTLQEQFGGQAELVRKTFTGQLTAMTNTLFDSFETVGKASTDFLLPIVTVVADMTESVSAFITENASMISGIMIAGTAITGIIAGLAGFTTAVIAAQMAWNSLNLAIGIFTATMSTTVIPALTAAAPIIAGVTAALAAMYLAWDELVIVATAAYKGVAFVAESIAFSINTIIDTIKFAFKETAPGLFQFFSDLWENLKSIVSGAVSFIINAINKVVNTYRSVKSTVQAALGITTEEPTTEPSSQPGATNENAGSNQITATGGGTSRITTGASGSFITGTRPANQKEALSNWLNSSDGRRFSANNPEETQIMIENTSRTGAGVLGISSAQESAIYNAGYDIQKRISDDGKEIAYITRVAEAIASQGPKYPIQGAAY